MKKVYIAHPLRGDNPTPENIETNKVIISSLCRFLVNEADSKEEDIFFISPVHLFGYLDATKVADNNYSLYCCRELVKMCDELWVFGDWETSEGCRMEIQVAKQNDMPITYRRVFSIF